MLTPNDFTQPLYIAPISVRGGLSEREQPGQKRAELYGGNPKWGNVLISVPFKCNGGMIFDRPFGGEELGRGYGDRTLAVLPGDSIVFNVSIG